MAGRPGIGEQLRRVGAQGDHVAVGLHQFLAADDAGDLAAGHGQRIDGDVVAELHAQLFGHLGQAGGEQLAVAGFVIGQAQAAGELAAHLVQRRFGAAQLVRAQQFEGHAGFLEHGDVLGGAVQLFLGAEQLQRALLAAFVGDADIGAQRAGSRGCIRPGAPCVPC
jgi:hypothetical protein